MQEARGNSKPSIKSANLPDPVIRTRHYVTQSEFNIGQKVEF